MPFVFRPGRSNTSDMYPRRVEGKIMRSVCQNWGHAGHQCIVKCVYRGKTDHYSQICCDKSKASKKKGDKLETCEVDVGAPVSREPVVTFLGHEEDKSKQRGDILLKGYKKDTLLHVKSWLGKSSVE